MRLEDMVAARLKAPLQDAEQLGLRAPNFGKTVEADIRRMQGLLQPWQPGDNTFQHGRLNLQALEPTALYQAITVEDIKYDRSEEPNKFAGTAKVTVDITAIDKDDPADNQLNVENKLRFTLRQLNRWSQTFNDGSRVLNCVPEESLLVAADVPCGFFGSARFTVRFVETEDLT